MNISCRIANADTQCGRITNPPEREKVLKKQQNCNVIGIFTIFAASCIVLR